MPVSAFAEIYVSPLFTGYGTTAAAAPAAAREAATARRLELLSAEIVLSCDGFIAGQSAVTPFTTAEAAIYFDEAMTQMVADSYAQDFNRLCAQKGRHTFILSSIYLLFTYDTPKKTQGCQIV